MKNILIISGFILLFPTHGCMTSFDPKEDTGSPLYGHDSNRLINQEADNGTDRDVDYDACPEDPNKTNPGECGCGLPEGACDVPVNSNSNDLCDPDPCVNGSCVGGLNSYTCQCDPGWTGAKCNQNINDCIQNPCVNGTCIDSIDSYTCNCRPGWAGANCEVNIDDCSPNPCLNGTCIDGINSYSCSCDNGWAGTNCNQKITECNDAPCVHGTCTDQLNSYSCSCEAGWTGAHCDRSIDDCEPNPCVHGSCLDGHNSYTCYCDAGWAGENCDQNTDDCPNDPYKTEPGKCGCGVSDQDSDNDGTPDCHDQCPHDSGKIKPGKCDCGTPEGACDVVEVNSNLQVYLDGQWRGVCCRGGEVEVSNDHCRWDESERVLKTTDLQFGNYTELDCPENGQNPADCACRVPGESLHGVESNGNRNLKNSLRLANGGPIYPNSGWETCIDQVNGEVRSRWTTNDCPHFRLVDHY